MFQPWQTAITKFLRYTKPVRCAYCGKVSRHHWTQLRFFRIAEGFEKKVDGEVIKWNSPVGFLGTETFPPLTPVCRSHMLSPIIK